MTAMCTSPMLSDLAQMIGYSIDHHHWHSPSMMSHISVGIDTKYTHHHFWLLKTTINQAINPPPSRPAEQCKVIIYTAAPARAKSTSEKLGDYLDTTVNFHNQNIITCWYYGQRRENIVYTHVSSGWMKIMTNIICTSCALWGVLEMLELSHPKLV